MVVACGLDYKMLDEEQQASVLRIVGQHLLTPKGLRSLSPRNPRYKNRCEGDEAVRAEASMNGSVWVWPLWFYVKASFDLGGREFLPRAEELLAVSARRFRVTVSDRSTSYSTAILRMRLGAPCRRRGVSGRC